MKDWSAFTHLVLQKKDYDSIKKTRPKKQKKDLSTPVTRIVLMEESMKKLIVIALLAMMLLSMLAMSACKPKPAEEPMEEAPMEEVAPVVDTLATPAEAPVAPVTQ